LIAKDSKIFCNDFLSFPKEETFENINTEYAVKTEILTTFIAQNPNLIMNRIILIGNGFDLAHGLKTSYKDFINDYWTNFARTRSNYEDEFARLKMHDEFVEIENADIDSYLSFIRFINIRNKANYYNYNHSNVYVLTFKNEFFKRISERTGLENWLDIEQEYYDALKDLLPIKDPQTRKRSIKKLNGDFCAVKNLLEKYLTKASKAEVESKEFVSIAFQSKIKADEIAIGKRNLVVDSVMYNETINTRPELFNQPMIPIIKNNMKRDLLESLRTSKGKLRTIQPEHILILNFNYTNTAEELYGESDCEIINIHGELNNRYNPIIFGYGDELDDDYKKIEKLQDNDFLENIKSIQYHKTRNYRELLKFIESEPYQVFVMGHSCGNSDRTLLNTLFEHENCVSLKVFYQQFEDGTDDYTDLIRNISRNFNDKQRMRDVVVDYEKCTPLVPVITL
jgi:hypothetical protein